MEIALSLVGIAVTVIVVARLCEPIGIPAPLGMLAVGVAIGYLPFTPQQELTPELVLYGLLPPLLYAAALNTSLRDLSRLRAPIVSLAVGLVLFTALGVAFVAYALLDISFALAFALGAIVAPPDAVAATAVARRIGLPRRITTILEGESLLNDATALVSLRTALAAAGLAVHGFGTHDSQVTGLTVARDFGIAVIGGVGIGIVVFLVVGLLRRRLTESAADTALSFATPFIAYLPAELIGASGVLAVVTTGLLLGQKSQFLQSAASRMSERINWSSVTFLLENTVFLVIGMQMHQILSAVGDSGQSLGRTLVIGLVILGVVIVMRPMWMIPFTLIGAAMRGDNRAEALRRSLVSSWAGMRGVVTLAAALTIPEDAPMRASLVLIALVVTVGTLVIQGLTLPAVARALDIRGPDPREDALQEATVVQASMGAGLRHLETDPNSDPQTLRVIKAQATSRINQIWERLGGVRGVETPSESYRRMRLEMIAAERAKVLEIRAEGTVDEPVLAAVLNQMDAEEASLQWGIEHAARTTEAPLRTPSPAGPACEHLLEAQDAHPIPDTPDGCPECLAAGTDWVHLRMCLECGHVGCCDSSVGKHAAAHFHRSGHPVMSSIEPGESWRWCYVDDALG